MPKLLTRRAIGTWEPRCLCGHDMYDHEFIYHTEEDDSYRSHDQPDEIRGCEVDGCTCTKYTEADNG